MKIQFNESEKIYLTGLLKEELQKVNSVRKVIVIRDEHQEQMLIQDRENIQNIINKLS